MDAKARRDYLYKERIVEIEFKISRLGILGNEYYELAQIKLKRHRTQISIARGQNLLLHEALETLREKYRIDRKNAGDLENLRKKAATLRVQFDHERQRVLKRHRQLEWQITGTHSAELECAEVLDPNTAPELVIRSLEHKLGWVQIKMQDVQLLVKHYEATLHPLRDEWIVYDAKLAALQDQVHIKNRECELLINTHHDAIRARDAAKFELEELLAFLSGHRKKGLISPDLRLRILRAIKEIKTVMDVGSMREMFKQFIVQEKQSSYLESIYEEMSRTLDLMRDDDYRRTRKKSSIKEKDKEDVARMIEGTTLMVRRQSEWRGAYPLLQILEGSKKLADRLHEGNHIFDSSSRNVEKEVLEKCRLSMTRIIQALYRQLKIKNKDAVRRAEYEAKESAHWQREADEVARKNKAAEDARRKYEERAAARDVKRQIEEELEARRQMGEAEGVEHDPLNLTVGTTPNDTEGIVSSANEYMLSQYHQLAKETQGEMAKPTVIFLPARRGGAASVRTDGAAGGAAVSLSDECETNIERSADPSLSVLSDDESAGESTRDGVIHSKVAALPDIETVSPTDQSEELVESPVEACVDDVLRDHDGNAIATLVESGSDVSGAVSAEEGSSRTEAPTESDLGGTDELPADVSVSEGAVEKQQAIPTSEESVAGKITETGGEITPPRESIPAEKSVEETSSVSRSGTIDQIPTAEPTTESGVTAGDKATSPQVALGGQPMSAVALSNDERTQEGGMTQDEPVEVTSSVIAMALSLPSTAVPDDDHKKGPTEEIGEGKTLQSYIGSGPGMTALSSDVTAEAIPKDTPGILSATVAAVHRDERVVAEIPTEEKVAPVARQGDGHPLALAATTVVVSSDDQTRQLSPDAESLNPSTEVLVIEAKPPAIVTESVVEILSEGPAAAEVLPSTPDGGPYSDEKGLSSAKEVPGDYRVVQTSRDTEGLSTTKVQPSTPTEAPGSAGPSFPRGKGITGETSAAQSPRQAELILPRSPSGAPRASEAILRLPEIVTIDETLLQRPAGGLMSPSLPRSPSGAPVATAARFPFDSFSLPRDDSLSQRATPNLPRSPSGAPIATAASLPFEPLSNVSRDESLSQRSTPSLPRSPSGAPIATAAKLAQKDSEPEGAGTSDPQE